VQLYVLLDWQETDAKVMVRANLAIAMPGNAILGFAFIS
jgi:hypothetical protein